eukprot:8973361-Pyramimonas_sp.AAC.1
MLGGVGDDELFGGGVLKLKAAETLTIMDFAMDRLRLHTGVQHHEHLLSAGEALRTFMDICRASPKRLSEAQHQALVDCCD